MRIREIEINLARGQGMVKLLVILGAVLSAVVPAAMELYLHTHPH